ncbi:myosin heavy, partial [Cystoisospora suis]
MEKERLDADQKSEEVAADLRRRLAEAQAELEEERRKQSRLKRDLEDQLIDLEKEHRLLRRTGSEMESQLKREIEVLKAHLSDQEKTFLAIREDLQRQYDQVVREKELLSSRIQDLTDDLHRLHFAAQRAETLKSELQEFQLSSSLSRGGRSFSKEDIEGTKKEDDDEEEEEERRKIDEVMRKHEEDLRLLKEEIDQVCRAKKLLEDEKSELDVKFQALQTEMKDLQNLYTGIQGKLSKALQEKEEENRCLSLACRHMEEEMKGLLDQTRQELLKKSSLELQEKERLGKLTEDLQKEVSLLKQDNSALQAKLRLAEKEYLDYLLSSSKKPSQEEEEAEKKKEEEEDSQRMMSRERFQQLEEENRGLMERLARLQSKYESMHALLRDENRCLKESLEKEKEDHKESTSLLHSLQKDHLHLQSQVAELREENLLLKRQIEERKKEEEEEGDEEGRERKDLQEKCLELTEKVNGLEMELQINAREHQVLTKKYSQLQDDYKGE